MQTPPARSSLKNAFPLLRLEKQFDPNIGSSATAPFWSQRDSALSESADPSGSERVRLRRKCHNADRCNCGCSWGWVQSCDLGAVRPRHQLESTTTYLRPYQE